MKTLYENEWTKEIDRLRKDNENLARLADSFPQKIAKLEDEKVVLLDILKAAAARIELANAEGDNILSAWLPDARAAITQTERKEP